MKALQPAKNPWIKALQNWEEIVTIAAVSIMLVVCCFSVIARRVFNYGIPWSTEVCNICLVYTTFIGGAAAYKRNLHFGMDFLTDHLNQKMRYFVKMFLYGVQILLLCFLLSLSVETVQLLTRIGCFDVDDMILNTLGGWLGYLVNRVLRPGIRR